MSYEVIGKTTPEGEENIVEYKKSRELDQRENFNEQTSRSVSLREST